MRYGSATILSYSAQVANEEISHALESTKSQLEELTSRFEEQKALNDRLENDLLRVNASGAPVSGRATGSNTPRLGQESSAFLAPEDPLAALVGQKRVSVDCLVALHFLNVQDPSDARSPDNLLPQETTPTSQPQTSAETSILPIITSQRDRFRQRNAELEEVRRMLMLNLRQAGAETLFRFFFWSPNSNCCGNRRPSPSSGTRSRHFKQIT